MEHFHHPARRTRKIVSLFAFGVALAFLLAIPSSQTAYAAATFDGRICSNSSGSIGSTLVLSNCTAAAGTSIIITFTFGNIVGNVSATDSAGNTYQVDVDRNAGLRTVILSAHNVNALAAGTITISHPTVTVRAATANQVTGLAANPLDQTNSSFGALSSPSSGNVTTTTNRQVLIGAIGVAAGASSSVTFTAGSGWNEVSPPVTGTGLLTKVTINTEYRIESSTGTFAADGTLSGSISGWVAAIATYKVSTARFTVNKDFSDNNAAAITVHLECSSGTVETNDRPASEGNPAVFDVYGFTAGATCTATESNVPSGYISDETNCETVGLTSPGQCTITNTLRSATFTVNKDFNDNNPMSVTIHLECTSGTIQNSDLPASEANPAVFSVTGFDTAVTCTATEPSPPPNYTVNQTDCNAVSIEKDDACTIYNNYSPTAINVAGFKGALDKKGKVVLHWRTTTESQIAGFNIYRRTKTGEWKQINAQFRAAKYPGTAAGAKYRFKDARVETGKTYYYRLEVRYLDGHSERTSVVRVITADSGAQTPPPRRDQ